MQTGKSTMRYGCGSQDSKLPSQRNRQTKRENLLCHDLSISDPTKGDRAAAETVANTHKKIRGRG